MRHTLFPVLVAVLTMTGQTSATESHHTAPIVSQAWARATPAAIKIAAAYVKITAGHHGDRLLGASSNAAERIEIHTHKMDGDKMSMAKVAGVDIPAGSSVTFEPGGYHFMLFDLRRQLKEGEELQLVLEFADAGKMEVKAQIAPAWALGPDGKKAEDHSQHHSEHQKHNESNHEHHDKHDSKHH